ncbi:MAG TPA: glycogen/starch synthase, partial [Polyangiaceae bacterium]|nr:glycogen/starch synthase [Polyangiaceae bacterium]
MDILFVASELAPLVKVGGLADVVAALSKALRLLGHRVTIAMPRFAAFEAAGVMVARRLTPIELPGAGERVQVTLFDGRLGSGVELLLLDIPELFDRPGVYGDEEGDYADNARRFGLFSRAVLEVVRQRQIAGSPFDVVHAHDWAAAAVPYLMKNAGGLPLSTKSVLTIHNLAHQGVFPKDSLRYLGLAEDHYRMDRLEFYGEVNFLKGGILAADAVTTVSATYAREILTPEVGEGLDGVLRTRAHDLHGVINGIDDDLWNPATDPALPVTFRPG